jgi:cAMP-dependent protein kinase regulator
MPVQPPEMPAFDMEEIEEPAAADPDSVLKDDVVGAITNTLQSAPPAPATSGRPVVASPLFSDFDQEELLAVMAGLELETFQPGDIIITEGEPGDSLFVLATGVASAWVKNETGRHVKVREMKEGAFFGEISILSGKPRTATVTAVTPCELLELNRATLESIASSHPRVRVVLQAFYQQRMGSAPPAPS